MAVKIELNVNLSKYTTFQIGGNADYFCRIKNTAELVEALDWAYERDLSYRVIGGGSNLLISDKGFRGLVILNRIGEYQLNDDMIVCDSGFNLSVLARETLKAGFGSLDFATGIPGTVGGAVVGNAGAYGKDISKIVTAVEVWDKGKVKKLSPKEMDFAYRSSVFKNDGGRVILKAHLKLQKGIDEKLSEKLRLDNEKRKQDYSGANAGSYFANIEENDLTDFQKQKLKNFIIHGKVAVGRLVDELGLKGLKVGGAIVSERHGNVILNLKNATASDVYELERTIKDRVLAGYGIVLRPEITKLGEF